MAALLPMHAAGMTSADHGPLATATTRYGPDTVEAVVVYGDHKLFHSDDLPHDIELGFLLDSLERSAEPPTDLIRDLRTLRSIRSRDADELVLVIDSLLDQDDVPYALINEMSMYLSRGSDPDHDLLVDWYGGHDAPASHLYGEWRTDTPNAYGHDRPDGDSLLVVQLVQEDLGCGAHKAAEGPVTSRFGQRNGRPHNGIDIGLRTGDPVYSIFPGVVRFAGAFGSFGRIVVVRHWNGLESYYAHLHRVKVEVGQEVEAGTIVGLAGSTGRSTGPHLHLEVRFKGYPIDPSAFMDHATGHLTDHTLTLRRTRWTYAAARRPARTTCKDDHVHGLATVR